MGKRTPSQPDQRHQQPVTSQAVAAVAGPIRKRRMNLDLISIEVAAQVLTLAVACALWHVPGWLRSRKSREAARKARQAAAQSVVGANAARAKAEEAARAAEVASQMRARLGRETRGYVHRGEAILPTRAA